MLGNVAARFLAGRCAAAAYGRPRSRNAARALWRTSSEDSVLDLPLRHRL